MKKVGVLRGGTGEEYPYSIKNGALIMSSLQKLGYEVMDMLIDKEGVLHIKGIPASLDQVPSQVDVVWNALSGQLGEDGQIQRLLDDLGIAYTGSDALASSFISNKMLAKEQVKKMGIQTPEVVLIIPEGHESVSEITQNIYRKMSPPWVLKPLHGSLSVNSYFAFTPLELAQFVEESISTQEPFLVEQYIYGKEAAMGVIDEFRGQSQYVLPAVEIKSPARNILTCDLRDSEHCVVGGYFKNSEKDQLTNLALKIHNVLGARDYSQSEFIIDKQGKVWYLETDNIPFVEARSPLVQALQSVGSNLEEFVKSIINRK